MKGILRSWELIGEIVKGIFESLLNIAVSSCYRRVRHLLTHVRAIAWLVLAIEMWVEVTSATSKKKFKGKGMACHVWFLFATTSVSVVSLGPEWTRCPAEPQRTHNRHVAWAETNPGCFLNHWDFGDVCYYSLSTYPDWYRLYSGWNDPKTTSASEVL